MSDTPRELKYASTHEWVRLDDGLAIVGISDHAQQALGDVVHVELPALGQRVEAGEEAGVIESVKAASDLYAPMSGTIAAANEALEETPETVNSDPYGAGWLFKIRPDDPAEQEHLLDAEAYAEACATD